MNAFPTVNCQNVVCEILLQNKSHPTLTDINEHTAMRWFCFTSVQTNVDNNDSFPLNVLVVVFRFTHRLKAGKKCSFTEGAVIQSFSISFLHEPVVMVINDFPLLLQDEPTCLNVRDQLFYDMNSFSILFFSVFCSLPPTFFGVVSSSNTPQIQIFLTMNYCLFYDNTFILYTR